MTELEFLQGLAGLLVGFAFLIMIITAIS